MSGRQRIPENYEINWSTLSFHTVRVVQDGDSEVFHPTVAVENVDPGVRLPVCRPKEFHNKKLTQSGLAEQKGLEVCTLCIERINMARKGEQI